MSDSQDLSRRAKKIRILIADDHGVLRAGLRALLNAEPDLEVVGEAGTGEEALVLAGLLKPGVVLMDISLPGLGGLEATRRILEDLPESRVLILTVHEDNGLLREAIRSGAAGYILKRAVETELITAIQAVARGEVYIHPAMTRALFDDKDKKSVGAPDPEALTPREADVLRLVAQGYTNRQVAEELNISVRTVETHRSNLMAKLNLESRVDLVRYAIEHGIVK